MNVPPRQPFVFLNSIVDKNFNAEIYSSRENSLRLRFSQSDTHIHDNWASQPLCQEAIRHNVSLKGQLQAKIRADFRLKPEDWLPTTTPQILIQPMIVLPRSEGCLSGQLDGPKEVNDRQFRPEPVVEYLRSN
jgi:hypothetical protein